MGIRAVVLIAVVIFAGAETSTVVFAQTPNTKDFCVFRNELYSMGAIICIGKDRALRCDGPAPEKQPSLPNAHWYLMTPAEADANYSDNTLGHACDVGGLPGSQ